MIQNYFDQAINAHKQCDFKKAKNIYKHLLTYLPHSAEILNNLGALALQEEALDEAIKYFKQVLEINPKHKESRQNLANCLLQKKDFKESIWHYSLFLTLEPNDIEALYNRAQAWMLSGQLEKALADLEALLKINATHVDAYCNKAAIFLKLNNKQQALCAYQSVLKLNPKHPIAFYMTSALTQSDSAITAAPTDYVKRLFNEYAASFDDHLQIILQYQTPQLMRQHIEMYLTKKNYSILDLGCGTGLSVAPFIDFAKTITGVDISANMLAQAKLKNYYDRLIEEEIFTFVNRSSDKYDLIICLDTLVYFGELEQLFIKIKSQLMQQGLFCFSIEISETSKTYQLEPTGRFQHNQAYIEFLAKKINLDCLKQIAVKGRLQSHNEVKTGLFILQNN